MKKIILLGLLAIAITTSSVSAQQDSIFKAQPKKTATKKHKKAKKVENYVLICNSKSAYAYHAYQCRGLSRCRSSVSKVTESEARAMGYSPCKICY